MSRWTGFGPYEIEDNQEPVGNVQGILMRLKNDAPAFASPYTPDITLGPYKTMAALTGALTVNAPIAALAANPIPKGTLLIFDWLQDGIGGRVVTYNAAFHTVGAAAATTAASTHMLDVFIFDGAVWRLLTRITGNT